MTSEEIAKLLLELKAVDLNTATGFVYASGKKGPIYCDNRLILSNPDERNKIVDSFMSIIKDKKLQCDFIAGVATGAIAWAAIIADRLKKPMVYIRPAPKDHGKENQIEGQLKQGSRILVIEDLINTGGSSISACQAVLKESCKIVACIAIFNYGIAGKKFAKIPLYSLTNFNELMKVASETGYIDADEKKILLDWQRSLEA